MHAGMNDALDAGQLWLSGNLGAKGKPGMTNRRREELRAEIALDDRPEALIRAARQAHPSDDLVPQQRIGVSHRVLEQLLLGFEIVKDDALRSAGLLSNLFDGGARHSLRLEHLKRSLAQFMATNFANFGEAHATH